MKYIFLTCLLVCIHFFSFRSCLASINSGEAILGRFKIRWSTVVSGLPEIRVTHQDEPNFSVWESVIGKGFLEAAVGKLMVNMNRGSFKIEERPITFYDQLRVLKIQQEGDQLKWIGSLSKADFSSPSHSIDYELTFISLSERELGLYIDLFKDGESLPSGDYRIFLHFRSNENEHFFGFGEQSTYFDLKGRQIPILVQEQGVGRGLEPLTSFINLVSPGSGGSWSSSYAPVPHYLTSQRHSFFLENSEYSIFDLTDKTQVTVELFGSKMRARVLYGPDLLSLVSTYTKYTGRMRPLPHWLDRGAIIAAQGGSESIYATLTKIEENKIPVSALWIQDWVGSRRSVFGSFLHWNWVLDRSLYPDWEEIVQNLRKKGIRILTYVNPFMDLPAGINHNGRSFFAQAAERRFFVEHENGSPYFLDYLISKVALIDLSQEAARDWIKDVIRSQLVNSGASGWMADFGEAFPMDARISNSSGYQTAFEYHNRYPVDWAIVQKEVLRENHMMDEGVVFTRSGFTRSPGQVSLFWLGDQLTTWDQFNGMKTALVGLLSSGLSGFSLNHSDIGGYTAITIPNTSIGYYRTKELFLRWAEMNAFTAMYRTHEGNKPKTNHQFDSDLETLLHFSRFAKIFRAFASYRRILMEEAYTMGLPLVRPLVLHFPEDPNVYSLTHEFLLGRDFLVAPILDPGVHRVNVYFPEGKWISLFSRLEVVSGVQGLWREVDAPIGSPAVFFRDGSEEARVIFLKLTLEGLL